VPFCAFMSLVPSFNVNTILSHHKCADCRRCKTVYLPPLRIVLYSDIRDMETMTSDLQEFGVLRLHFYNPRTVAHLWCFIVDCTVGFDTEVTSNCIRFAGGAEEFSRKCKLIETFLCLYRSYGQTVSKRGMRLLVRKKAHFQELPNPLVVILTTCPLGPIRPVILGSKLTISMINRKARFVSASAYLSTLGGAYATLQEASKAYLLAQRLFRLSVSYSEGVIEVKSRVFMAMAEIRFGLRRLAKWNLRAASRLAKTLVGEHTELRGMITYTAHLWVAARSNKQG